ncbi:hypothetical protein ACHAXT_009505 [Thalassiosira profunda]
MLAGSRIDDEDGATVLADDLSVCDDDAERNRGRQITSAQAREERRAARRYRYTIAIIVLLTLVVSAIVAAIRFGSPRLSTGQQQSGEGALDLSAGNGLREKENEERLEQTLQYLVNFRVSHWTTLDYQYRGNVFERGTGYSPQYRAAVWIARRDLRRLAIPSAEEHSKEEYPFLQRYALTVLFFSLGGLDGWTWRVDFLQGFHECDWHDKFTIQGVAGEFLWGAMCDGAPDLDEDDIANGGGDLVSRWNAMLSKSRVVTAISLPPLNHMQGTLPSELHHLKYLKQLHVQFNQEISGSIPFEYGWLEHLSDLTFTYTSLEGKIPRTFAGLAKMEMIDLSHNSLRGNTLDGDLDFLKGMSDLTHLSLSYNSNITGTLPDFSSLIDLEELSVSNTGLYGTLPSWLPELTQLKKLRVDDCAFDGSVNILQSMKHLTHVYIEDNSFTDSIDDAFFADFDDLVHLDVSNCSFNGTVPGHLFQLPNLEVLDMSVNQLDGVLPADALGEVNRSSPIDGGIAQLTNLTTLDLSSNQFTGTIPDLSELADLQILFLGRNLFIQGPVPTWLREMKQLTELSLKSAQLYDTIPTWLGELTKLTYLDLGENTLIDTIPQSLGNLTELMVLMLNSNRLEGELGLGQLEKLEALLIDDNAITGNTDAMCAHELTHFIADCASSPNRTVELNCTCCTLCCSDENATCNDSEWLGNHLGIWEYGYKRRIWDFDENGALTPLVNYNQLQSQP